VACVGDGDAGDREGVMAHRIAKTTMHRIHEIRFAKNWNIASIADEMTKGPDNSWFDLEQSSIRDGIVTLVFHEEQEVTPNITVGASN
jgi:hypothetical protein